MTDINPQEIPSEDTFDTSPPEADQEHDLKRHRAQLALTSLFSGVLISIGVNLHLRAPYSDVIYVGNPKWASLASIALDPIALSVLGLFFLGLAIASALRPLPKGSSTIADLFLPTVSGTFALMAIVMLFTNI